MRRLLLLLVLALGALAGYVWSQPSAFRVERSAVIDAPSEVVFRNLEDFHRWAAWSPWEKLDPALERDFDGPNVGVGASYHWRGSPEVGEGRMTITESRRPERLTIRLEFLEPMQATNETVFVVSPHVAGLTEVRWAMSGTNGLLQKAIGLVVDVGARVGEDFDRGLAELKRVSEEEAAAQEAKRAAEASAAAAASLSEAPPGDRAAAPAP
jgi:uncharacterized protein YndB with AHSA1/START domain